MNIEVKEVTLPQSVDFNYEEIKAEITKKVSVYSSIAYTEEMISEAKKDKAELNKLKKALNDERIARKKEFMKPFEDFECKVKELCSIIDEPIGIIDSQVKEYEKRIKDEKKEAIYEYWQTTDHGELTFERIFVDRWLNASVSMKSIKEDIDALITKYSNDMLTLAGLPEFSFEAQRVYKDTLDLTKALNEANRRSKEAKEKAEIEERRRQAQEAIAKEVHETADRELFSELDEDVPDELPFTPDSMPDFDTIAKKEWYSLNVLMDKADLNELRAFLTNAEIKFSIREV